ncbi:hypothetical protein F6X40_27880 [Paraburkholderia sp. UCT31]|uniref:hypothetical protein n=1 Tax=Paraburkholderia sp. UCT31 TaxID=2615209 RepID=UPI0016551640|nr:hypothetical protein [Paraburkholderia sp. UCT31]MBC8740460.1 hypothetical protein [Paraburkholderia sp. UCT31]
MSEEKRVLAPMPSGVEKMSKEELWDWMHRSQTASAEQTCLRNTFFSVKTGLHSVHSSALGNADAVIELQRERIRGLEMQCAQMQKGYKRKVARLEREIQRQREVATAAT